MSGKQEDDVPAQMRRVNEIAEEIGARRGRFEDEEAYDVLRRICVLRSELGIPTDGLAIVFRRGLEIRGEKENTIRPYVGTLKKALFALDARRISEAEIMAFDMNRLRAEIAGNATKRSAQLMADFQTRFTKMDPEDQEDLLTKCLDLLKTYK